jgi:cytochrome c553
MRSWLRWKALGLSLVFAVSAALAADDTNKATINGGPPDTIAARVQGCSTCHGSVGEGTKDGYFPRIAGKPAGYLFNQLQNFREGRRSYPPMNYLLAYLHDDYLTEMATFFSAQRVAFVSKESSSLPAADLGAGANLVMHGNAHGVPACMACHGPKLTGMNPGIPGLIGLHSRYISAQLEAWRAGTRRAKNPDCMHDIATRLSETEITVVSAWLSMQTASAALAPAAVGHWQTPLPCGSEPQ